MKGIEPSYAAWEAAVLPLNYTRHAELCPCGNFIRLPILNVGNAAMLAGLFCFAGFFGGRFGRGFFIHWCLITDDAFKRAHFKNRTFGTANSNGDGAQFHLFAFES